MELQFKNIPNNKKIYLASDFHLGAPSKEESLSREKKIVRWLDAISDQCHALILVGDIFDFWFEYKHVIPRGFVRFQGKLAELRDKGIPIIFFTGNHDLWMFDYFEKELGIPIIRKPTSFQISDLKILIGHGDGVGPGDKKFKVIKKVFTNKMAQWGFRWLHPTIGFGLAHAWSSKSKDKDDEVFAGEEERILQYCRGIEQDQHHDYYIFGHRHLPLEMRVNDRSIYLNLGDWCTHFTYIEVNEKPVLKTFEE